MTPIVVTDTVPARDLVPAWLAAATSSSAPRA